MLSEQTLPATYSQVVKIAADRLLLSQDTQLATLGFEADQLVYRSLGQTDKGRYKLFLQAGGTPLVALQEIPDQPARLYRLDPAGQLVEIFSAPPETTRIDYQPDNQIWFTRPLHF